MTFVKMYMDIYEKYGAKSPEMTRYKEAFIMYKNKPHVVERVYRAIMSKKTDRWMRSTAVRRRTSKRFLKNVLTFYRIYCIISL